MIVSVHQPNFAPWLGFFDKMVHSDVMVLLDSVQFIKRGYQNRAKIKGTGGPQWLTIPVISKGRYDQLTRDVEIDESRGWRSVHLRTLQSVLAKAPHRDEVLDFLDPIYAKEELHNLADFNTALIRGVVERLGITTQLLMASELGCQGSSSRLMLNLTKAVGGETYLSGPSGSNYLEPEMFPAEGVKLQYHRFEPFEYPQAFPPFAPGLSCLDYLANVGFRLWGGSTACGT
ncbi:WbqC-like protein [Pseudonocardia hierapolitana]|uniref:WbqC-like protein n=1 Tax=Pseudonocardia hierapolitana TaxID=1128676 RepID=A0A561SVX8_9PSEU|nr:WbqC family protein [Pseudonocardia hierapolitana]TWF79016.1 WbqC-like protein [Pseudonocardia hierapolitana]